MSIYGELVGLATVALAAAICGVAMTRLRQPAIVGYILAGIILGPSALGLVQNREQIDVLAELGVLLLLFFVGMELSLGGLRDIWRVAVLATLMQVAASVAVMLLLSTLFGWSLGLSVLLGFVVALSSTAVVVKMLEDMGILQQPVAKLTIAILLAQDLAFVPMMLIVGQLAGPSFGTTAAVKIVVSIGFLMVLIGYLSRREKVRLPFAKVIAGHADLAPLWGLAYCFGGAALSGIVGLSPAYGAFLAGLVIANSAERDAMIRSTQPIQSVLMMAFFLSIGLLIDLEFIWAHIGTVLLILLVITVFKTALNIGILHLLREPWVHAFFSAFLLAQIGEFSFLLGKAGLATGLIGEGDHRLIVAVTALSLVITPAWLTAGRRTSRIMVLRVTSRREIQRLLLGRLGGRLVALALTGGAWLMERAAELAPRRPRRARRVAATGDGGAAADIIDSDINNNDAMNADPGAAAERPAADGEGGRET